MITFLYSSIILIGSVLAIMPLHFESFEGKYLEENSPILMNITYNNGAKDQLSLMPHPSFENSLEKCIFEGKLKSDPSSHATVTGCQNGNEFEVTLLTSTGRNFIGQLKRKTLNSRKLFAKRINHKSAFKGYKNDFIVLPEQKKTVSENKKSYELPDRMRVKIVVAYDQGLKLKYQNDKEKIVERLEKIMSHTSPYYQGYKLGTNIDIEVVAYVDISSYGTVYSTFADIYGVSDKVDELLTEYADANLVTIFSDQNTDYTLGLAFVGVVCDKYYLGRKVGMVEVDDSITVSANIAAHELGHNFGLPHTDGCGYGLMYPTNIGAKAITKCSRENFKKYFNQNKSDKSPFCLEIAENETTTTTASSTEDETTTQESPKEIGPNDYCYNDLATLKTCKSYITHHKICQYLYVSENHPNYYLNEYCSNVCKEKCVEKF